MKISQVIDFLARVHETKGDLDLEFITGLWVKTIPSTGEQVVSVLVHDDKPLADFVS